MLPLHAHVPYQPQELCRYRGAEPEDTLQSSEERHSRRHRVFSLRLGRPLSLGEFTRTKPLTSLQKISREYHEARQETEYEIDQILIQQESLDIAQREYTCGKNLTVTPLNSKQKF